MMIVFLSCLMLNCGINAPEPQEPAPTTLTMSEEEPAPDTLNLVRF